MPSVSETQQPCLNIQNNESFSDPGTRANIFPRAATGHKEEPGKFGMVIYMQLCSQAE